MESKLYVGNLSYGVTEDQLRDLFSQAGAIREVALIMDRETRRPKGFGFVEMGTEEEAKEAIRRFDNGDLLGKTIKVNEARAKTDSRMGDPRRGSQGREPKFGRGWKY